MRYHKPALIGGLELIIEVTDFPSSCVIHVKRRGASIAKTSVIKDGNCWILADIVVQDFKDVGLFCRLRSCGFFRDYRSKGIGTALIKELINFAKERSVRTIKGTMVGDIRRLSSWYKSLGFSVGNGDAIWLDL